MPYIRWLHKSWSFFWNFIGVLVLTLVLLAGAGFGFLQLQPTKNYIAGKIEDSFNNQYQGVLSIGKLEGVLPLQFRLEEINIYSDSTEYEPVFSADEVNANVNLRSFLRKRIRFNGLKVTNPSVVIDQESTFSFLNAVRKRPALTPAKSVQNAQAAGVPGYEFIAPSVRVERGSLVVKNALKGIKVLEDKDSVSFRDIDLTMYLELTSEQRFMDIDNLTFKVPELDISEAELFGQIYNDDRFLEFNAFNVNLAQSRIRFSGEADGVDLMRGNVWNQIRSSYIDLDVDEVVVDAQNVRKVIPEYPDFQKVVMATIEGEGSLDSLWFDEFDVEYGESYINAYGYLKNIESPRLAEFGLELNSAGFDSSDIKTLPLSLTQSQVMAFSQANFSGSLRGNGEQLRAQVTGLSPRGSMEIDGSVGLSGTYPFDFDFKTDSLDIGGLFSEDITRSDLTLQGSVKSNSWKFNESEGNLNVSASRGSLEGRYFDGFSFSARWDKGYYEPDFELSVNGTSLKGQGSIDLTGDEYRYSMQGSATSFNLKELIITDYLQPATVDMEYDISLKGNTVSQLYGLISIDIPKAIVGADTLGRHQLYFDFNEPGADRRSLRFTSTAFDATIEGEYNLNDLLALKDHWQAYFTDRINREILFREKEALTEDSLNIASQNLTLTARLKNLQLVKAYFPLFPSVTALARINSNLNISSERLLFNASVSDPGFRYDKLKIDSLVAQVTGSFKYDQKLKDFSGLQVDADILGIESDLLNARDIQFYAEMDEDSLFVNQSIARISDDSRFNFQGSGHMSDTSLFMRVENFTLGSDFYTWKNRGTPSFEYTSANKLVLNQFAYESQDQFVLLDGTYSASTEDSVSYLVRGVDLGRISEMINGQVDFGGELNGTFTTRTLTTIPTIQGEIDIQKFLLDGNTVGDITVSSTYNAPKERFDTKVRVKTDSAKYPEYFSGNDRKGQDFEIDGYIRASEDGEFPDTDSLYVFNANFDNIDSWILPYVAPKVFLESAGMSDGKGKLWGNLETYDYHVNFNLGVDEAVYMKPRFLDTYYYAQGAITWTRARGFTFEDIFLIDPSGGRAILSGYFDVNDFQPLNYMDIRLEMNEFQFLNSSFDPTLPFFGKAYGSSTVTITGTNFDPVLSTEEPVVISDFSEIGIPLLDETEFDDDNKFIRFVDSFDVRMDTVAEEQTGRVNFAGLQEVDPSELSFAERFTLDLQFVATNPMTVRLIFDPVTGDIVTAEGTGRLRIRLEDEQVSMFGRFDITGGRYNFVSGDIISRRFELEPGGTIIWEGDPSNARIDLNAVYSARPDINTLSTSRSEIDPENAQRVRVDLVLNIGGTLSSIENEFFFRLPDTFESRQNSTLATQLAALNRNEEDKVLQAASFLLMGDFIPVTNTGVAQGNALSENFSGSAAVLNPLLSNQVISPLLSNQINSLLNSDLSSLDVDFNLNTYNQVDLGVALRLYNDKIILRREGQITGRQSNIGDLGATYRINKTFSVTAFHRQDPTFGTISSTEQSQQSQDINGLGVEAKVSFNTWKEFFNRLASPFRRLFGINDNEETEEEITENLEGGNPS